MLTYWKVDPSRVTGAADILSAWKSHSGVPGGSRARPSSRPRAAPPRSRPPGACRARGPMCSAAARALPGGARGRRAARDVRAARAPGRGGGEARAARPAACVLGPRARGVLPAPAAPPAGRPPREPLRWLPGPRGPPSRPGPRAGGAGLARTMNPEGAGEGALRPGMGSQQASANPPPGDALSPFRALSAAPLSALLPAPAPASWRQGAFPLARCGRRVQ